MNSEALKIKLIHKILSFDDVDELKAVDSVISNTLNTNNKLNGLAKPIKEKLDIEQIKKAQNFQPIDTVQFSKELDDLEIKEPLEDLLKMI